MISVYTTSTALEAHMILNLLEQEGIAGRVDGAYLTGGVGELQALDLVRVMVDEADAGRARQIIRDWESIQVAEQTATVSRKPVGAVAGFVAGLVVGGGAVFWACHGPPGEGGIDTNGDDVPDVRWIYRHDRLNRAEVDRNAAAVSRHDSAGEAESDDSRDGVFAARIDYRHGLAGTRGADLDQGGEIDQRAVFTHDLVAEVFDLGPGGDRRCKQQEIRPGKRASAGCDADGDGRYAVKSAYDVFGEVK